MIFDKLLTLVRNMPELGRFLPMLDRAKLFELSAEDVVSVGEEVVQKPKEYQRFLMDTFFLPFPTICADTVSSAMVMEDTVAEQRGLADERRFIFCGWFGSLACCKIRSTQTGVPTAELQEANRNRYVVVHGTAILMDAMGTKHFECSPAIVMENGHEIRRAECKTAGIDCIMTEAFYSIMTINSPDRFVMEISSTKPPKDSHKHPYSHERPCYTLIRPQEIRKYIPRDSASEDDDTGRPGTKKCPHVRRRHFRHLTSDHWVNKKGQHIIIPAMWVGPAEAVVGNKKYKVLLDR